VGTSTSLTVIVWIAFAVFEQSSVNVQVRVKVWRLVHPAGLVDRGTPADWIGRSVVKSAVQSSVTISVSASGTFPRQETVSAELKLPESTSDGFVLST